MGKDRLTFDGANLSCLSIRDGVLESQWSFDVTHLECIGEYTTAADPIVTDYFIVFFAGARRYQASMYADGRDDVLKALSRHLATPIIPELGAETSFNSRVIWPSHLQGHPVFVLRQEVEDGFIRRLWARMTGKPTYDVNPSLGI